MSGGYFDYKQYELETIADTIESSIRNDINKVVVVYRKKPTINYTQGISSYRSIR